VEQVIDELPTDTGEIVLAMKSTVPVGTGARMQQLLDARGLGHVRYVSNPEFLKEGDAIADFMHPDRVVIGGDDERAVERMAQLHAPLETTIVRTDVATAEMIKVASNAFLATKISFINEIANVCEETGADVTKVANGMGLDQRIGRHFLRAGIGFGGSCFGKDVSALKQLAGNSGYHFQILNSVMEVNELQKRRLVAKIAKHLGDLRGKTVALLGLAFKPGTDDMREAASLVIASRLLAEGAFVRGHDPVANEVARPLLRNVEIWDDPIAMLEGADAAVLVTEWPEYAELDLVRVAGAMKTPLLVDGRNLFSPAQAAHAGLTYEGVGRPGMVVGSPRRRTEDTAPIE
jgi:UDPglucose 6-dehydrogenase